MDVLAMRYFSNTTLFQYWMIIVSLLFLRLNGIDAWLDDQNNGKQYEVNICFNQEEFRCPDGHLISVQDVVCADGDRTCTPWSSGSLSDVCNGHQTCSNIGLRNMFSSHCDNRATGVICKFKCIPGKTAKCRSNICAQESQGLTCSPGSTLHIQRVTCSGGDAGCSRSSYNVLTSLCEGSVQCEASGLRTLLSPYCHSTQNVKKQVFVEYICVPAKLVHDSCSSFRDRPIRTSFGILRQPKVAKADFKKKKKCKWVIASPENHPIQVDVLLVQSKVTKNGCDPNFLRIRLVDCAQKKVVLNPFCDLQNSSAHLRSCGPIKITSSSSVVGDRNNEFIVSYQSFQGSNRESYLLSGLSACVIPPAPIPRVITLPAKPNVSQNALHDTGPKDLEMEGSSQSGSFRITLKMLLLYIFLGALILVLLTALITVLVRYHRISLPKNNYADSSENVILWKRYDDTALDVFQQNGIPERASDTGPLNKVTATVHHDPVPDHEEVDNRVSSGSGFSSFLPLKRISGFNDFLDSYQLSPVATHNTSNTNATSDDRSRSVSGYDYHELPEQPANQDIYQAVGPGNDDEDDDDTQFGGHYSNPNSLSRPPKNPSSYVDRDQHLVVVEDHRPLVMPEKHPKDDYHYCVNNDEYAVVKKPHKPTKTGNGRHLSAGRVHRPNGMDHSNGLVDFCPTSGPYDKTNYSRASNSSYRKSREAMWRDEV